MKKMISLLCIIALFSALIVGCGSSSGDEKNIPDKKVLKFSILENEQHGQGVLLRTFKEKVEELSGGKIEVQAHYNGALYNQDAAIPALTSGELEMTLVSLQITADYLPSIGMLGSTFMFRSYEHMHKVMDGEIGDEFFAEMEEHVDYVPLGYYYNGSRQLNLRFADPVVTPEDMKGVILRMPSAETWLDAGESLGASVTPMAYGEVYTALQNGTIDAQDNPMPAVKTSKFYEVTKQMCMTYHIIDFGLLSLNKELWQSLNDEEKSWLLQAADEAVAACDKTMLDMEAELVSFFEGEGLTITYPDIDAFAEYAHNYYVDNGLTKTWDMDLYDRIQALAE